MKKNMTSAELKCEAKTHLYGNYNPAIGAYLSMNLFLMAISIMMTAIMPKGTMGAVTSIVGYVVMLLLSGIFAAGNTFLYLNIYCGQPVSASLIFYGFKNHTDKILLIQLAIVGLICVAAFPAVVVCVAYQTTKIPELIVLIGVCLVLMIVGVVLISLIFMPAFYLIHDFPDYTVKEILSMCRTVMKGNMGRLFYLYVSFIPIQLLGLLTFGIGSLWIEPYINETLAGFFMDIMRPGTSQE